MRKNVAAKVLSAWLIFAGWPALAEKNPHKLLYGAILSGSPEAVAAVLDGGVPLGTLIYGESALSAAAFNGKTEVAQLLLERGAELDQVSGDYELTALASAARMKRSAAAELLIKRGADVQAAVEGLRRLETGAQAAGNLLTVLQAKSAIEWLDKFRGKSAAADSPRAESAGAAPSAPSKTAMPAMTPNFTSPTSAEDYAVVIGIEDYADIPDAVYAERDAAAVRRFFAALGVPERNIVSLTGSRATKTGLEKTLEAWLPNNVSEKSRVFVYFSGHGAPDPKTGDAYLVPSDGDPQYLAQTGYPLKRLYAKLAELKTKHVLVALDSCFSGAGGRSVLAKGTRPLVGKVNVAVAAKNSIAVLSASGGDQISGADEETGYGLFTYNLLQGLNGGAKDAEGKITLQSLYEYVKPRIADQARRVNREQTPQLSGGKETIVLRQK